MVGWWIARLIEWGSVFVKDPYMGCFTLTELVAVAGGCCWKLPSAPQNAHTCRCVSMVGAHIPAAGHLSYQLHSCALRRLDGPAALGCLAGKQVMLVSFAFRAFPFLDCSERLLNILAWCLCDVLLQSRCWSNSARTTKFDCPVPVCLSSTPVFALPLSPASPGQVGPPYYT